MRFRPGARLDTGQIQDRRGMRGGGRAGARPGDVVITGRDRVVLAPGVRVEGDRIHDDVRGTSWALNETGRLALTAAPRATNAAVADELSARYAVDAERVAADVRSYVAMLNERLLVNVERGRRSRLGAWYASLMLLAGRGIVPSPPARRLVAFGSGGARAALRSARALTPRAGLVAAAGGAALAALLAPMGAPLDLPIAVAFALYAAVVVHEAGHVLALRGVPCCVVVRGVEPLVVHRTIRPFHRGVVAVAGPLAAAAAGWLLCAAGAVAGVAGLPIAALVLLTQPLALTVAGGDGRIACALS
jgi:hypothetical protein